MLGYRIFFVLSLEPNTIPTQLLGQQALIVAHVVSMNSNKNQTSVKKQEKMTNHSNTNPKVESETSLHETR